jgi:NADP-dependent 3-hydroxy acid dehydrogenase YdfG
MTTLANKTALITGASRGMGGPRRSHSAPLARG